MVLYFQPTNARDAFNNVIILDSSPTEYTTCLFSVYTYAEGGVVSNVRVELILLYFQPTNARDAFNNVIILDSSPTEYTTCLFSVYTKAGTYVSNTIVDVPSEAWEGEGATLTCSHPDLSHAGRVKWYNGTVTGTLIYIYKPWSQTGLTFNDPDNRFEGQADGNVHKLTIRPTSVKDEGNYTCKVDTEQTTGMLTVSGEYLEKVNCGTTVCGQLIIIFMLVFLTIGKCCV